MALTVLVPDWLMEGGCWPVTRGGTLTMWLTFFEEERFKGPAERVTALQATATPLDAWPGAEFGRHPTRLKAEDAAVYWDAPRPTSGAVGVRGTVEGHKTDAPDRFPMTQGVITRVRNMWRPWATDRQSDPSAVVFEEVESASSAWDPASTHATSVDIGRLAWCGALVDLEVTQTVPVRSEA